MPGPHIALCFVLVLIVTNHLPDVSGEGYVGCLFSQRLCLEEVEWCFDDYAFGRCLSTTDDLNEDDLYRYDLDKADLHTLSSELKRLFALGYRWSHAYTQCRLQSMLHAIRNGLTFEHNTCSHLVDQDLGAALKALELEDPIDPEKVAIVEFVPSKENPHADFADEVYYPPVPEKLPFPQKGTDIFDIPDPYADNNIQKHLRVPRKRYASPNFPTFASDNQLATSTEPELSSQYYDMLSNLDDETLNNYRRQFLEKRVYLSDDNEIGYNFYPELEFLTDISPDKNQRLSVLNSYDILEKLLDKFEDNERKHDTNVMDLMTNNIPLGENNYLPKRFSINYNTPNSFRKGWEARDYVYYDQELPETRVYDNDDDEQRQEYGSGDPSQQEMFGTLQQRPSPSEVFGDEFVRRTEMSGEREGQSGIYTEGGLVFVPDSQIIGDRHSSAEDKFKEELNELLEKYDMGFKRPERLDVKKPGPPFDTKIFRDQEDDIEEPTKKNRFSNSRPKYDNSASDYVHLRFKQKLNAWSEGDELINEIMRLLNLEPEAAIDRSINPYEVSFKVDLNEQNLNASDVIGRIDEIKEELQEKSGNEIMWAGTNKPSELDFNINIFQDQADENDVKGSVIKKEPRGAHPDPHHLNFNIDKDSSSRHDDFNVDPDYVYVGFKQSLNTWKEGEELITEIRKLLNLEANSIVNGRVDRNEVTFKIKPNSQRLNASDVAKKVDEIKDEFKEKTGIEIIAAGIGDKAKIQTVFKSPIEEKSQFPVMIFLLFGIVMALFISITIFCVIHHASKGKVHDLSRPDSEASKDYQDLCRARMASKLQPAADTIHGKISSLSKESEQSPSSRSSTSSWSEEPALHNMDISTGHMVLSYMEDHLKNKDRLEQEWVALCAYEAEPCATTIALKPENVQKNRYPDILPYDHARVILNELSNATGSDYINASSITDHDPRNPAYIATQGPLPNTSSDFWQMIWEQGTVVIVVLTRLTEGGTAMCHRYWPEEGSELYHIYEVHLVSEHIWCDDYLVRSFYLKNTRTGETRTVTQFHFLSWPDGGIPSSTKTLLEFRRKVNKSYRGRSCPIVVQCSDGAGRTGTYCLIDMVLSRMAKGAKEIDIAATLEHLRDQRPKMVATKQQFEFVLTAVAEEVHAILKALPPQPVSVAQTEKEKT